MQQVSYSEHHFVPVERFGYEIVRPENQRFVAGRFAGVARQDDHRKETERRADTLQAPQDFKAVRRLCGQCQKLRQVHTGGGN